MLRTIGFIVAFGWFHIAVAASSGYTPVGVLGASDAGVQDAFSISTAVSGLYALVGAPHNDDNGSASGSAYLFKKGTNGAFTQTAKLTASDGTAYDYFGNSVAISGDYAVVGAYGDDDKGSTAGSAYLFKNNGSGVFTQTAKLTASDGTAYDYFGNSVAINGDYAVVGAYGDDDKGSTAGSAYLFKNNGSGVFTQTAKLTASDGAAGDYFGFSVAIAGSYVAVGASKDDDKGSVYLFKNNGSGVFAQVAKLTASDGGLNDRFGASISLYNDYVIVGAYYDQVVGYASGSAYVFKNNGSDTFTQIAKLAPSDPSETDFFGFSVAISGDYVAVGAFGDSDGAGSAYIFKKGSGESFAQTTKLTASGGSAGDYFGASVAIDGQSAIIGAYGNDTTTGSAYTYKKAAFFNPSVIVYLLN